MKKYFIFLINQQIAMYYKNKPSVLYKTLDEIYHGDESDLSFAIRKFKSISEKLNTSGINEYIYNSYKNFPHYSKENEIHIIKKDEAVDKLEVKNIYISLETTGDFEFVDVLNEYNERFFIVNFDDGKYCWLKDYLNLKGGN